MSPRTIARRAAFLVMILVTAWSVWALGQPKTKAAPGVPGPGIQRPVHPPAPAPAPRAVEPTSQQRAEKEVEAESEHPGAFNFGEFGKETPPYLAMLLNFGILIGGYYLLGKDSIAAGLRSRREAIQKDLEEARQMREEAEERAKKYQARLATLEQEMNLARDSLLRAGEAERERIVKEAEAKAERMRKDAEFLVEQELKQIRLDLWRDAVDTAIAAAEELLKKRVTPADQERLAEEYLAELGAKPKASATGGVS